MPIKIEELKEAPTSVKRGIILLFAGWAFFWFTVYFYYAKEFFNRFFIGGLLVLFCILLVKNWARMLAILSNAMVVVCCAFFGALFYEGGYYPVALISAVNVVLFALSAYFLFIKSSGDFFKKHSPKASPEERGEPREPQPLFDPKNPKKPRR